MKWEDFEIKALEYLDGTMNASERKSFEIFIETSPELKQRLNEIRTADLLLRNEPRLEPSIYFTKNVLASLDQKPYQSRSIFNNILLLCGIIGIVAICVILLTTGAFDSATTHINLDSLNIASKYVKKNLPSIAINGKLMVNIVIILNLLVALLILDKGILKPLFQKRMRTS